ncbi:MAG TPA: tRNA guanosine(34) transglycosylase Tgt [Rhodospirillales bacterium]|nr:tRNA guanosine(34) transglycosylase Tgt [Rhodospirillales bacterium]
MTGIGFRLDAVDGAARAGTLSTAHGEVATPAFMPVGTAATVKAMTPEMLAATGARMVLANTYHLMLRPGAERIARLGGLHAFMRWPGPILTDSGGYQVMSLSELRRIDEDGVDFRSHVDGSRHRLTPARAVDIQRLLDADISMVLDECPRFGEAEAAVAASMRRSMRWAALCREAFVDRPGYGLFGIVQGGVHRELRAASAKALLGIGFDGYAVGGLAVGEGRDAMFGVLDVTTPLLPESRPRYLMGVGKPEDLLGAVARGIDLFDCVLPTRSGRTGQAFTRFGPLNLRNARHAEDPSPLDESVPCAASRDFSRAYLHHLVRCSEILGAMLLTSHNLAYYAQLMAAMRDAIVAGTFSAFAARIAADWAKGDIKAWYGTDQMGRDNPGTR